jgi:sulfite exporter TauE/SafE
MAQSALIAAFMAGLLGGLHCIAMCGGYVTALAADTGRAGSVEILHARKLLVRQTISNIARIATYSLLGAVFGSVGAAAVGTEWVVVQRVLYVLANLLLLVLAYAVATGRSPFAVLERAGLAVYRRLLPAAGPLVHSGGLKGRFALGLVWGLTPCGLVYSVLPVAMLSGSALDGALVMLLFGLGTLPNLLAAGFVLGRGGRWFKAAGWRHAAGVLIAGFALAGLYRAWFVPGALAHGPFCIVP